VEVKEAEEAGAKKRAGAGKGRAAVSKEESVPAKKARGGKKADEPVAGKSKPAAPAKSGGKGKAKKALNVTYDGEDDAADGNADAGAEVLKVCQ
jgi:hypothetical protein